ncbi:MAG: hypothetical protein AAFN92_19200, partial [Bacteroidota bacterium]
MRLLLFSLLLLTVAYSQAQTGGPNYYEMIDSIHREPLAEWSAFRRARAYDRLAEMHYYVSQSDSSLYYNNRVFEIGHRLRSDTLLGLAYRGKSTLMMQLGQVQEALPYADTATLYFQRANYPRYVYLTQRNLGYQYARVGDCVASQRSLKLADSLMRSLDLSVLERAKFRNTYAAALEKCRHFELMPGIIKELLPEVRKLKHPTLLGSYYNRLIIA